MFNHTCCKFCGIIDLSPSGDEWFETETAPDLIVNVEGNFNAVLSANRNAIGTVWNAWETTWSGTVNRFTRRSGQNIQTVETTRSDLQRTGLRTRLKISQKSLGTKVIARSLIPFVRPRNITFTGQGFKPNTRVYVSLMEQTL